MKFRISLILLLMVLVASSGATAAGRECTDSTIKGSYAFTIHGQTGGLARDKRAIETDPLPQFEKRS